MSLTEPGRTGSAMRLIFDAAKRFMDYHLRMVPSYWEPSTLQDGYVRMSERDSNG